MSCNGLSHLLSLKDKDWKEYICLYIYIYIYIYICIYIYVYIYVYIYMCVCMYVCMYACMYVCMHACICMYVYNTIQYVAKDTSFGVSPNTLPLSLVI